MSDQYACCKCEKTFAGGPTIVDGGSHCDGCAIEALTAANAKLQAENTHLRAALAMSKDPCTYCQLPKEEMAKCKSGFPGCARMDDMTGCPEFWSMMNESMLREEVSKLKAGLAAARRDGERLTQECKVAVQEMLSREWETLWEDAAMVPREPPMEMRQSINLAIENAIDAAMGKAGE